MKFNCPSCNVNIPHYFIKSNTANNFLGIPSLSSIAPNRTHSCPRCNVALNCKHHPLHKLIFVLLILSCLIFIAGAIEQKIWLSLIGAFLFIVSGYIFGVNSSYKNWNYYNLRK